MGFDCDRFENPEAVDPELICSICRGVFDNPFQLPDCEHVFCAGCIERWLQKSSECPIDRRAAYGKSAPRSAPRIFRNLLNRMRIRCSYHEHGCQELCQLDQIEQHEATCEHNPEGLIMCGQGCGSVYKKNASLEHNCIAVLREKLDDSLHLMQNMSAEITNLKRRMKFLEEQNRSQHARLSVRPEVIEEWAGQLTLAHVTYWGGLISTPDTFLQNQVREALESSCAATNCPVELIEALMQNSHERAWPPGLRTLERRLLNRTIYEAYACRRVPGSQAVVILYQDNHHMSDDMILQPGLVVIFAHGVQDSDVGYHLAREDTC